MNEITFTKMQGAGNDFLLVDDRDGTFPLSDRDWIARIAARRTGVGCEGILLVQRPVRGGNVRMRFLNPDGGEVDMCGNGARCLARFAHDIGAAPERMTIETRAGLLQAERDGEQVRLRMTEPRDWDLEAALDIDGQPVTFGFVNTGVPHVVIETGNADEADVAGLGRVLRRHERFAPEGTNVNFVQRLGPDRIRVRTYERGVEAETLACGTGIVACALVMARRGAVRLPVGVRASGGHELEVGGTLRPDGVSDVTLTGPAVTVYRGRLAYDGAVSE